MTTANYIDPLSKPYPFCPGCSHANLFDEFEKALQEIQPDPKRLVVVSDIGCIGIGDRHFLCHTFHGLHGRSITYATGLKLARPDLTVVVLIGDGGLGIGGTHFLNAARRNVDITVIVANNFNFGMTGGQHSVTTPHESLTTTTPYGNYEYPLDVCGLAIVAGCNFAARTLYIDKGLKDMLKEAILTKGFSVVDVWELCIPYFTKNNQLNRKKLEDLKNRLNLPHGTLHRADKSDFSSALPQMKNHSQKVRPVFIESLFENSLKEKTRLSIAGTAGKKIKSAATLLCHTAVSSGLYTTQRDDYPVTVMSGHSVSEIVLDPNPIDNFGFDVPDILLLVSEEGLKVSKTTIENMKPNGTIYTFEKFSSLKTQATVKTISEDSLKISVPKTHHAFLLLCFFLKETNLFSWQAFRQSIETTQKSDVAQKSLEILDHVSKY